jgi:hypothetical protein
MILSRRHFCDGYGERIGMQLESLQGFVRRRQSPPAPGPHWVIVGDASFRYAARPRVEGAALESPPAAS